jgi:hypothetical protein
LRSGGGADEHRGEEQTGEQSPHRRVYTGTPSEGPG